ncbi:monocarboxylate transporter 13-like isoform X2 [Lineus longissimus]|uniref:monocarboxylate transporter 13-like isoform X2 n=1 Tax=Lineus longissimus TaxID=88925 RepID=UPI00315DF23F
MSAKMLGNLFQYRYVLLVTCFTHMAILAANLYSVGIYYVSWIDEFKVGSGMTSWIGAVLIGSLTVVGFGMGITLVPSSTAVAFYFKKRARVLSVGLVTCGSGFGAFLMPYVINACLAEYGWRGTLLINTGINLHLFVTGALIRTPPEMIREELAMCRTSFRRMGFVLLLIHHSLVGAGISIVYIHISAMTEYLTGVSREFSNLILSAIGLANLFGRVFTSAIANCRCRGTDPLIMSYCFSALMGVTALLLPLLSSYAMVVTWAISFGFFLAPNTSLAQIVVLNFVDISEVNAGLAYVLLSQTFGYVSGPPIAGALYDATGDYGWSFYLGGACILAGVFIFTWPLIVHCRQGKDIIVEEDMKESQYLGSHLGLGSAMLVGSHVNIPGDDHASEPMVNGVKTIRPGEI